ncbi:MAG: DUF3035 domain-containing protein [Dongiaceae bacterium]
MRRSPLLGAAVLLALGAGLGGCSEAQKAFGLSKDPPDEFQVVSRAPLSLPPNYNLVPPAPGAPRPQEGTTRDQARNAVFGSQDGQVASVPPELAAGDPGGISPDASPGEQALLQTAGAGGVSPAIRQEVNAETAAAVESDQQFLNKLIFWRKPDEPGVVIDAAKEQQRLQENAALGKPVTEGETPVIIRRKKALLEGIF